MEWLCPIAAVVHLARVAFGRVDVPRASKRAAAPAIVFDQDCTLASVFEKLDAAARAAADEPVDVPVYTYALDAPAPSVTEAEYIYSFGDLEPSEEPDEIAPEYPKFGAEQTLDEIFEQIAASCAGPSDDDPAKWDLAAGAADDAERWTERGATPAEAFGEVILRAHLVGQPCPVPGCTGSAAHYLAKLTPAFRALCSGCRNRAAVVRARHPKTSPDAIVEAMCAGATP
jgi:hypothetical protein